MGYKPNQKTGECENSVPNCVTYDANTGECQQCGSGYQIILYPNKACKAVPEFCARVDPWGNCTECRLQNRVLTQDKQCILQAYNCLEYEFKRGLCTKCFPGFYLNADQDNAACFQNPQNCESALSTSECQKCFPNFVLTSGRCYPPIKGCLAYNYEKCQRCQLGQFVDSSQMRCLDLPRFCSKVILNTDGVCE